MRHVVPAMLAVLGGALAGCGDTVETGPVTLASLPPLSATETLRIGDVDDPDRGFSRLGGLDIDRLGV